MPINRIASHTRSWSALRRGALVILAAAGCAPPQQETRVDTISAVEAGGVIRTPPKDVRADSLSKVCPALGKRGSLQVARVDAKVEEGGVAFDLLGDGAGDGVVLCRDVLYADLDALKKLMRDTSQVSEHDGVAVIDGAPSTVTAYDHDGVLYVAVRPFARTRGALVLSSERPTDAIVWPRRALLHLKKSGLTQGRAYQTAVREGLLTQ
jgi:hypothetical protein